jgi:hypothetical protein
MNKLFVFLISLLSLKKGFSQKECIEYSYIIPPRMTPEERTKYQAYIDEKNRNHIGNTGKCKSCEIMEIIEYLGENKIDTLIKVNWEYKKCVEFYFGKQKVKKKKK